MTLKETLDIFGYEILATPSNNIETLLTLRDSIPNSVENFQAIPINKSLKTIKKESRNFMNSHFRIHNICYLKKYEETPLLDGKVYYNLIWINEFDPYNLPIEKHKENYSCCESKWFAFKNECLKFYFKKIKIEEKITEFTSSNLTHEIVHTQQDEDDRIKYYNNTEILPILIEIIHYVEKCFKRGNYIRPILSRLKDLVLYIDELSSLIEEKSNLDNYDADLETDIILHDTYIESILKALNLFGIYEDVNANTRKQMLNYIQNIFDANRSVEEFLEHYDTTFESSVDSLQKKINRIII